MPQSLANPFVDIEPGSTCPLPSSERFAEAGHLWRKEEIDALILAWAARRPLLVRGEAGCGKSQIARAAAAHLYGGDPLVEVIHPRFEALDLLYLVDLVARLADAQISGALDPTNRKYVKPGRLWQAMAADAQNPAAVLLIDEIDKADAEVPNALLDVLGNRSFPVPQLDKVVSLDAERHPPLVVITTNEERELPAAFVRRCIVLNLSPPRKPEDLIAWLVERGQVHHHLDIDDKARWHAARQVAADRAVVVDAGYPPVGLAEYIDLLTAIDDLTRSLPPEQRGQAQLDWLDRLGVYALRKHQDQPQDRGPVSRLSQDERP